jgi:hypothetical protein
VLKLMKRYAAGEQDPDERPILMGQHGKILDGHHRWAALRLLDAKRSVSVLQFDAPVSALLPLAEKHSIEHKALAASATMAQLCLWAEFDPALHPTGEGHRFVETPDQAPDQVSEPIQHAQAAVADEKRQLELEFDARWDGGVGEHGAFVATNADDLKQHVAQLRRDIAKRIGDIGDHGPKKPYNNSAKTVDELREDALRARPSFHALLDGVAKAAGGGTAYGPEEGLKSVDRLREKVAVKVRKEGLTEQDIVTHRIADALRGTIWVHTPEDVVAAVTALRADVGAAGAQIRVENLFESENPAGYGGIHCDVTWPAGEGRTITTEVQVHFLSMADGTMRSAKEQGEAIYKKARVLPDNAEGDEMARRSEAASHLVFAAAYRVAQRSPIYREKAKEQRA